MFPNGKPGFLPANQRTEYPAFTRRRIQGSDFVGRTRNMATITHYHSSVTLDSNEQWVYASTTLMADHRFLDSGKFITWIKCDGFTSHDERVELLCFVAGVLDGHFHFNRANHPVRGKLAFCPDEFNRVPLLFYSDQGTPGMTKSLLDALSAAKTVLLQHPVFSTWLVKQPCGYRAATWNFKWKSDEQTLNEVKNGTHLSQLTGRPVQDAR